MRLAPIALLLLLPAGCVPAVVGAPACDEPAYDSQVGLPLAEVAVAPRLTTRVIRPGNAWTDDLSPGRLNIVLDDADRVVRFWCG